MAKVKVLTNEQLNKKTVIELRELCRKYDIAGMSKARKEDIIDALESLYSESNGGNDCSNDCYSTSDDSKLPFVNAQLHSFLENDQYKTLICVSCGAASNNYPVVGRSVGFVKATYREILNIDDSAEGIVNGVSKSDSYILKSGDILEFVRQAGKKG